MNRKGSVLLQTLVICIVLSYIAIAITKWALGRYTESSHVFVGSSASLESQGQMYTYLSRIDPCSATPPCVNTSGDGSPNSFSYGLSCENKGNVKLYKINLDTDGKSDNAPYANSLLPQTDNCGGGSDPTPYPPSNPRVPSEIDNDNLNKNLSVAS